MAMPATDVVLIGLYDAKLSPMTADVAAASGGPTYGAAIDIPGVTEVSISSTMDSKELKGDGSLLATYSKIVGGDIEIKMAKLPLAALVSIQGGAIASGGSASAYTQTYTLKSTDTPPGYWKIEGAWNPGESDMGDVHAIVYKIKCTEPPTVSVADANGDYGSVTIKGKFVACASHYKYLDYKVNETVTAII